MKDNIIDFRLPEEQPQQVLNHGKWIKIEKEGGPCLIETLMVGWLGAWSLIASVEFLRIAGMALF